MNIGEANDVQRLLRYLLDPHDDGADGMGAAVRLAARANERLGTGFSGNQVIARWPQLLEGCPGCDDCTACVREVEDDERPIEDVPDPAGLLSPPYPPDEQGRAAAYAEADRRMGARA